MKAFIVFDARADSYQVSSRIGELRSIDGVKSVEAMERVAGEVPRYCLTLDIEDNNEKAATEIKNVMSQYSSYISNVVWGAYKSIG